MNLPWIGCRRVRIKSLIRFDENPYRNINRLKPVIRIECADDDVTWICHSPI
jgi:hypothetical protein